MKDTPLDNLIRMLSSLPGLGNRSARRIALHLLNKRHSLMIPLAQALEQAAENIRDCEVCGNLDIITPCSVCCDFQRDRTKICVVANVSDVWAIERTGAYKGLYHVLGGLLSALDGIGPSELRIEKLIQRIHSPSNISIQGLPRVINGLAVIEEENIDEIILALSATVAGQSTAHYITDHLLTTQVRVTRLAHGVPVGGELDYLDDGTIVTALRSRNVA